MFNADECFENMFDKEIAQGKIMGANVLVIRNGEELFAGSYGLADKANNVPMTRDRVFRMFSMSKPVTSVAVMILVERGIIDLNDRVEWYLPGFKNGRVAVGDQLVPVSKPVQLKDLMNMTSGVSYPGDMDFSHTEVARVLGEWEQKMRTYDHPATVDFANAIGECPLAFEPGAKWMYGFSADILGAVVEVASGMPYGEFLRREIFEPLGMKDTGFDVKPGMRERMSKVYQQNPDGVMTEFTGMNLGLGDFPDRPIFESGGAGLLSTIDDYSKFCMMLANDGTYYGSVNQVRGCSEKKTEGVRILGRNTVRFLRSNQLTDAQREGFNWDSSRGHGYGNLVRILEKPELQPTTGVVGEFGWDGWLGTYMIVVPETKTVLMMLRQTRDAGSDDITRKFRAIGHAI